MCWASATPTPANSSRTGSNPVIDLMPEQRDITDKGGTMRLGAYPCKLMRTDTKSYEAYQDEVIYERHRHRYEFNNLYRARLPGGGAGAGRPEPQPAAGGDCGAARTTPGLWASSSTPSSRAAPTRPILCSADFIQAAKTHHCG